ncbi:CHY-type/CTCHY-type/RING-type Zinc finger protein [Artemisia annua]|uniref:CHY-type/CTCHY-type/RING-type Zinc finger protein n=1 Tax=Artemisia annua TaxID=35608 RepID=A0A2U1KJ34_ARTAN|nr:CHY-type/CTCHY-type/RING-type Zinc finger protein [Artemisia annua]
MKFLIAATVITKNSLDIDPLHRHDVPRHEVKKVICTLCDAEQDLTIAYFYQVQQNCINCGVYMGNYFSQKCKFFDDDVSKNQYHYDQCGICRTGGEENFFHCDKCGIHVIIGVWCCYSKKIKDTHVCVERAMHHDCPICSEKVAIGLNKAADFILSICFPSEKDANAIKVPYIGLQDNIIKLFSGYWSHSKDSTNSHQLVEIKTVASWPVGCYTQMFYGKVSYKRNNRLMLLLATTKILRILMT